MQWEKSYAILVDFALIAVFIADGVGLVGKLPLVLPLYKYAAVRVCGAFRHRFETRLFPLGQLLFEVLSASFWRVQEDHRHHRRAFSHGPPGPR